MSISIRSNTQSLAALRNLNNSSNNLAQSFKRLSSGSRINSSADDAGGQSVADSLRVKVKVKARGKLNAGDAISELELLDGAADAVGSLLQRMSELAQQAANGVINSTQRASLNKEFEQLDQEIRRIATTTTFNDQTPFKGQKAARVPTSLTNGAVSVGGGGGVTSSDGRFITYYNTSTSRLEQRDLAEGTTTTIASGISDPGGLSTSAGGDVVFSSTANLAGQNPSGYVQVYHYNRSSAALTQITHATATEASGSLAISADGSTIAFQGNHFYSSSGATTYNASAYFMNTYNIETGLYSGLSTPSLTQAASTMAISADGRYVGFMARSDPLGTNPDGNGELYMYDTQNPVGTIRQATSSVGAHSVTTGLVIGRNGNAYFSSTQNHGGTNSTGNSHVFQYNYAQNTFTNLTSGTSGATPYGLALATDDTALFFVSNANLTGENASAIYQLQSFDFTTQRLTQLTNYTTTSGLSPNSGSISRDGHTVLDNSSLQLRLYDMRPTNFDLNVEAGESTSGAIALQVGALHGTLRGLGGFIITSRAGGRYAVDGLQKNIEYLGTLRGQIGSNLSRLGSAVSLLTTQTNELSAARSRITDVDVADETARLTKNQILQQAGIAILAQANQQPHIALGLLGIN